jgi:hypothetical protein
LPLIRGELSSEELLKLLARASVAAAVLSGHAPCGQPPDGELNFQFSGSSCAALGSASVVRPAATSGRQSLAETRPETVALAKSLAPGRKLRVIAEALALAGHLTRYGTPYAPTAVRRI